jgi:hypothetical protein
MDIGQLASNLVNKAKDATIGYQPDIATLESNKTKALIGVASLGIIYIIPGDHPILSTIAFGYSALKGYQAMRDWAGK